jgi:hypothetical protein
MELMKFMESKCDVWSTIQELSVRAFSRVRQEAASASTSHAHCTFSLYENASRPVYTASEPGRSQIYIGKSHFKLAFFTN